MNKIILITQYYQVSTNNYSYNEKRQKEIDYCLLKNLENKYIDEIHLLTETNDINLDFIQDNNKIIIKNIGKRITYKYVFDYYNKYFCINV